MDADNKMSHVCRTCLEGINDVDCVELNDATIELKDQLVACVPELDLGLVPNAYLCLFCARALQNAYDFKTRCLEVEGVIRDHVRENVTTDLDDIKQVIEYNVVKSDLGIEIVYISDDVAPTTKTPTVHSFLDPGISTPRLKSEENRLQTQVTYSTRKDIETMFCCSECNFKTSRSFLLKQHKVAHNNNANGLKKYACDLCPFETSRKLHFRSHQVKNHAQATHKLLQCVECNFKSYSPCGFGSHMLRRHGVRRGGIIAASRCSNDDDDDDDDDDDEDYHTFACKLCDFVSNSKSNLFRHVALAHKCKRTRTNVTCPMCPFRVKQACELKYHMTLHSGDRQFKCKFCSFNATRAHFVQKHMVVHEKNY